jgi:hypothetical protein
LNSIGCTPEELSPLLYINLSVTKKLPLLRSRHLKGKVMQNMYFYIAYNQSADKNPPHPPKIIVSAHKKGYRLLRFALFFRGLASCEWKVKLVKLRYN